MRKRSVLVIATVVGVAAALGLVAGLALARGGILAPAAPTAPTVVSYQGEVLVDGEPYTGTAYFKFAVVNAGDSICYWSNDGSCSGTVGAGNTEPTESIALQVQDGLFSVLLGNTSIPYMTEEMGPDVFATRPRRLHVWFDVDRVGEFTDLGLTVVAAVPYALNAETLDGLDSEAFQQNYDHVVVVAKSGGDYTSIQAAIDSISDAGPDSRYLVWVGPGTYTEQVSMRPHVHIQGAGQELTVISSTATNSGYVYYQATLVLTRNVSLRDLTVTNVGTDTTNVALNAGIGVSQTLVANVTLRAVGSGSDNFGAHLEDSGPNLTFLNVTALAENGSVTNDGLRSSGAQVMLRGGTYTGRGGGGAAGLICGGGGLLEVVGVTALGENGSGQSTGCDGGAGGGRLMLRDSTCLGREGGNAYGIANDYGGIIDVERVTARGENGGASSYGLYNKATGGSGSSYVTHSLLEGITGPVYCSASGFVSIHHSQLVSPNPVIGTGTTTCVAVSRGITFTAGITCP